MKTTSNKRNRNQKGFSIAEFGPALIVLLIGFFFPLLDMITIGITYGSGDLLNSLQLREACRVPASEAQDNGGYVKDTIPREWQNAGVGKFVNLDSSVTTKISYYGADKDSNGIQDQVCVVTTQFTTKPFLTVPVLPGIPGLTAPMSMTYTSQGMLENPGFVSQ
jgi:hypothetical protein